MKLGFFTMPVHPPGRDYVQTLKEDREAFILADRLGYTEGYCGEHLTDAVENIPNSLMFIATLLDATKQMKVGTAVANLPFSHPVIIASNVAMLDNLFEGRFILGIGAGVLPSDSRSHGPDGAGPPGDVRRGDRPGAGDLGERRALRHQGQVLERLHGQDQLAGGRRRLDREAVPETASVHRRHRVRPGVERRHRARQARLGPGVVEPAARQLPAEPLGQLRQGCGRGRPQGRSRDLAGGALDLRRRRRGDRARLRRR